MPTGRSLFTVDHFAPMNDFTVLSDVRVADRSVVFETKKTQRFVRSDQIVMIDADLQNRFGQRNARNVERNLFVPLRIQRVAFDIGFLAFDFISRAQLQRQTNDRICRKNERERVNQSSTPSSHAPASKCIDNALRFRASIIPTFKRSAWGR